MPFSKIRRIHCRDTQLRVRSCQSDSGHDTVVSLRSPVVLRICSGSAQPHEETVQFHQFRRDQTILRIDSTAADVAFYGEAVEKCIWRLLSGKDALYTVEIDQVQAVVDVGDSRFGYGTGFAIPNQRAITPHFDAKFLSTDAARPREIGGCEFNR